jgi:hypothetical protein
MFVVVIGSVADFLSITLMFGAIGVGMWAGLVDRNLFVAVLGAAFCLLTSFALAKLRDYLERGKTEMRRIHGAAAAVWVAIGVALLAGCATTGSLPTTTATTTEAVIPARRLPTRPADELPPVTTSTTAETLPPLEPTPDELERC